MFTLSNMIAVLVGALAAFVVGFLIHGPIAGKLWLRLTGIVPTSNEKFSDMYGQMFWNFVVNVFTATGFAFVYTLAATSPLLSGPTLTLGLACGAIIWLMFLVPSSAIEVIWMGRSKKLWLFEVVSSFAVMMALATVVTLW